MNRRVLSACVVFLAVFAAYLHTMYPAFKSDDSPNTVVACAGLASQHAPGYPLVTLVGRLFSAVPAGGPGFRAGLGSASAGAAASALLFILVAGMFAGRLGLLAGSAAVLSYSFMTPVWDAALSAKGLIYQANIALFAGMLLAIRSVGRGLLPAALLAGLGLAGHWMTMACLLPVLAAGKWTPRRAAVTAVLLALGASLYLQLPLSVMREPVWGDAGRLQGLIDMVLRRDLSNNPASRPWEAGLMQSAWGSLLPLREGGPLLAVLAVFGVFWMWRSERGLFLLLWPVMGVMLAAIAAGTNPLHRSSGELMFWHAEAYFIPLLFAVAASFGAGVSALAGSLSGWRRALAAAATLAVAVAVPVSGYRGNDHSSDYLAYDYGINAVAGLEPRSLVAGRADFQLFPLMPPLLLEGRVPGAEVLMLNPLQRAWGWRTMRASLASCRGGRLPSVPTREDVAGFLGCAASRRPVYVMGSVDIPEVDGSAGPAGLLGRLAGAKRPPPANPLARMRTRGLVSRFPRKDGIVLSVLDNYVVLAAQRGEEARMKGDLRGAVAGYLPATRYPGWLGLARVWRNIGVASGMLGDNAMAEAAFRNAVAIRRRDAESWGNLGVACAANGKAEEAERHRETAARLKEGLGR